MIKKSLEKALHEMDPEIVDEIANEICEKRLEMEATKMKTINFKKRIILIATAAALVIAAVMIPLAVMMNKAPEPATQPPAVTGTTESNTEKQTTLTDVQPGTPTNVDPTKPTDDPIIPSDSTIPSDTSTTSAEIEYASLYFDTIDELRQSIVEYKNKDQIDPRYSFNKFSDLTIDYYPNAKNNSYKLMSIEINPYNVFYYFVPDGEKYFDYKTGVVVTFPREKEATIEVVGNQLNASFEEDGSFFSEEHRTWFIPVGDTYFSIAFPDTGDCNKSLIELVEFK